MLDNPISYSRVILPGGPVRATFQDSSVTTGVNWSTRRKPAIFGRVKLDNTLLTCNQGNLNQITARSRNRALVAEWETRAIPLRHQILSFSVLYVVIGRGACPLGRRLDTQCHRFPNKNSSRGLQFRDWWLEQSGISYVHILMKQVDKVFYPIVQSLLW